MSTNLLTQTRTSTLAYQCTRPPISSQTKNLYKFHNRCSTHSFALHQAARAPFSPRNLPSLSSHLTGSLTFRSHVVRGHGDFLHHEALYRGVELVRHLPHGGCAGVQLERLGAVFECGHGGLHAYPGLLRQGSGRGRPVLLQLSEERQLSPGLHFQCCRRSGKVRWSGLLALQGPGLRRAQN